MKIKYCRICKGANLSPYLNLGFTPPADSFIREQGLSQPEVYYPLEVCLCEDCGISQLTYTVPPDVLYQHDYPYESSITRAGRAHFLNFASSVVSKFNLKAENLVIDIGSNVGVLLEGFKINGCRTLGIEPSANIAATAIGRKIETINDFISTKLAFDTVSKYGKASVITATNVFAHIDDLDDLVRAIDILLDENGVFIIEAPHFLKLIKNLEYDTIYHEHLLYVSIGPLGKLFNRFNFEVFDVEEIGIHGGSVRIFVSRLGKYAISNRLIDMISLETNNKIFEINRLTKFSREVL
ncbi:MAG: class I SAM-dependent methyltransferase, partial [Alphaproteobacteria bacterium]|nr:class I SAM-dependent methyltransferase [Alphaproteobacteria bacterium]